MKKSVVLLLVLWLPVFVQAQEDEIYHGKFETRANFRVLGNVKSITEESTLAGRADDNSYSWKKKPSFKNITFFEEKTGVVSETVSYNYTIVQTSYLAYKHEKYLFNDKGRLIKKAIVTREGKEFTDFTWIYNDKDQLTENCSYAISKSGESDSLESCTTWQYNNQGKLAKRITGRDKTFFTYESVNDTVIKENAFFNIGKPRWTYLFFYDKNNNLIKTTSVGAKETKTPVSSNKYDGQNRETEYVSYGKNKKWETKIYTTYHSSGQFATRKHMYSNGKQSETTYEYNEKNLLIKEVRKHTGENAETLTYEYKYDDRGNWIEKITYQSIGSETAHVLWKQVRTIEYYD